MSAWGEGSKPKLVTVQPLNRGTSNQDGPTVSSSMEGGSKPIVIENIIMLD